MLSYTHGRSSWFNRYRNDTGLGGWGGDDAAGDAVAGVAGGVGLHVVGLLVDHDGGAAVGEDAVGGGGVEREVVDVEGGLAGGLRRW